MCDDWLFTVFGVCVCVCESNVWRHALGKHIYSFQRNNNCLVSFCASSYTLFSHRFHRTLFNPEFAYDRHYRQRDIRQQQQIDLNVAIYELYRRGCLCWWHFFFWRKIKYVIMAHDIVSTWKYFMRATYMLYLAHKRTLYEQRLWSTICIV